MRPSPLDMPLATTLLSNGAALLFLLWYVMPREVFAETTTSDRNLKS